MYHFSTKYQIDRNVGSRGVNLGQLMQPHGIATLSPSVSGENGYQLIIADTGNNRVQVIDAISGQFSRLIGGTIKGGKQKFVTKMILINITHSYKNSKYSIVMLFKTILYFFQRKK